ncbi:hypothetical protein AB0I72_08125 [Nocardiopsis sp. NPDC049922]|uniref:hypothetical protein n=1 Tax=Nocardiopsis sp. NPDC049922 TaxID=3155157 RepID=UPI0033D070A9
MEHAPLVAAKDRFSTGLPGRRVPVSEAQPSAYRPWGMDHAVVPRPVDMSGRHEKPTENKPVTRRTQYNDDGKLETDTVTETHTD